MPATAAFEEAFDACGVGRIGAKLRINFAVRFVQRQDFGHAAQPDGLAGEGPGLRASLSRRVEQTARIGAVACRN
jgi:hypothetical protein